MAQPSTTPKIEELRFRLKSDAKSRLFFPLAEELRKVGQFAEAEQVLRTGLQHHPTYLSAWVSLGRVLRDDKNDAGAVEALTRALQLDPGNVVAARLLGDAYLNLGEKLEALKKYKLVQALMPSDEDLTNTVDTLERELNPPPPPPPAEEPQETAAALETAAAEEAAAVDETAASLSPFSSSMPEYSTASEATESERASDDGMPESDDGVRASDDGVRASLPAGRGASSPSTISEESATAESPTAEPSTFEPPPQPESSAEVVPFPAPEATSEPAPSPVSAEPQTSPEAEAPYQTFFAEPDEPTRAAEPEAEPYPFATADVEEQSESATSGPFVMPEPEVSAPAIFDTAESLTVEKPFETSRDHVNDFDETLPQLTRPEFKRVEQTNAPPGAASEFELAGESAAAALDEEREIEERTLDFEPMHTAHEDSPFEDIPAAYTSAALEIESPEGIHIGRAPMSAEVPLPVQDDDLPSIDAAPLVSEADLGPVPAAHAVYSTDPLTAPAEEADVFAPAEASPFAEASPETGGEPFADEAGALAGEPEDIANTLTMADLYARQGLVDDARQIYENILNRDPHNDDVRRRLDALTGPAASPEAAPSDEEARAEKIRTLEQWLGKVTRREVGSV